MKPMTHGEIRGTLMIAALLVAVLLVVAVVRSCGSSSAPPGGGVVEVLDPENRETVDSAALAEKVGAYLRADSLRKSARDSLRIASRDSADKSARGPKPPKSRRTRQPVKMNDSPLDRAAPER